MARFALLAFSCMLLLSSIHNVHSACPANASFVNYYGGNCYDRIFTPDMTWPEARAYCESEYNGALMSITLYSERSDVISWLWDTTSFMWIGGYTLDYSFSDGDDNSTIVSSNDTDIVSGNFTDGSNDTTSVFTLPSTFGFTTPPSPTPAPNGFLLDSNARWYWANKQGTTDFSNELSIFSTYWGSGQPTNASGACVAWRGGAFYAMDCDTKLDFVCEYSCGGIINTGDITTISSSNYPRSYSNSQNCIWEIDVGQGNAILELKAFSTESCCDRLYVYESANSTTPLNTLSGTVFPARIISPSNTLYIRFRTDGSVTGRGFTGTVRGSTTPHLLPLRGLHGVVTTDDFPEVYTDNQTTGWIITVDRGAVNLMFTDFDLQSGTSNGTCDNDRLEVRDESADGRVLATLCGSELPSNITSFTGSLYLNFTTDSSVVRSGFRAIYWSSAADCVHILNGNSGEIQSPGYGTGSYPARRQCAWYIDAGAGLAKLKFDFWDVDYTSGCSGDKVLIYDGIRGNTTLIGGPYCGSSRPSRKTSGSRYMTVYFTSDRYWNSDDGFHGTWRSSTNCSQTIRKEIGNFTSPEYPDYYEPLTNCTWLIDVLSGNATLQLRTFRFQTSETCYRDRFQVHDGNSSSAPQVPGSPFCGSTMPDKIVASSQYLFVNMYTDSSSNALGFVADFWSSDWKCHMWGPSATTFVYKDRCYGLFKSPKDWVEARTYCEAKNTSLLYIESREEFSYISDVVFSQARYFGSLWTGGYRRTSTSANWLWSTLQGDKLYPQLQGGESFWIINEPGTYDRYATMGTNGLVGTTCSSCNYWFVCKESLSNQTRVPPYTLTCGSPPQIQFGFFSPTRQRYNNTESVQVTCDANHQPMGGSNMTCRNGTWTGHFPVCIELPPVDNTTAPPLTCSKPPSVTSGRYNPAKSVYTNGTTITVKCVDKYRIKGTDWLTCNEGNWQGFVPVCEPIPEDKNDTLSACRIPPSVQFGLFKPQQPSYPNGTKIRVQCTTGYELRSKENQKLSCFNGHWQGSVPVCRLISTASDNVTDTSCPNPPLVLYGSFVPNQATFTNGSVVKIQCNPQYEVLSEDHQQLTCMEGYWNGFIPVCLTTTDKIAAVPEALGQTSDKGSGNNKDYTTVLAVTLTVICILVLAIIVGVVWFVIKRRSVIPNQPLVEMH